MGERQMDARSGQQCSIDSWQSALLPVEWGLVVLDVPDSSVQRVWVRLLMSITMAFAHNHTQTLCMPT